MSWFTVRDAAGGVVRRVFALTKEDLEANVPAGGTACEDLPDQATSGGILADS